jgi:hypothetical protein
VIKRIQLYYEIDDGLTIESDFTKGERRSPCACRSHQFAGPAPRCSRLSSKGMTSYAHGISGRRRAGHSANIRTAIEKNGDLYTCVGEAGDGELALSIIRDLSALTS